MIRVYKVDFFSLSFSAAVMKCALCWSLENSFLRGVALHSERTRVSVIVAKAVWVCFALFCEEVSLFVSANGVLK